MFSRRTDRPTRVSSAFTLIELLTVIAIIGVLAAILIPVVGKVRESARNATCLSNLRELGTLTQLYIADNKDMIPPCIDQSKGEYWWHRALAVYLGDNWTANEFTEKRRVLYGCNAYVNRPGEPGFQFWTPGYGMNLYPGAPEVGGRNWVEASGVSGTNARRFRITQITRSTRRIYIGEGGGYHYQLSNLDRNRHGNHTNVLFFDFHVAGLKPEQVDAGLTGE